MKPNISEFSYGFALTSELIQSSGMQVTAVPVFPSLYQEGRPGGDNPFAAGVFERLLAHVRSLLEDRDADEGDVLGRGYF